MIVKVESEHISFEDFQKIDTVSHLKNQLRKNRYKHKEVSWSEFSGTQQGYLYTLWRFHKWLVGREFSCLVIIANKLNKVGRFTYSKDWKTIQKEWNENADPIDDFASNYIIDGENHKTKRDTYHFYKEIMLEKGETPRGIGQFSKAFSEYHDEDRVEINGRTQRTWLNISFKIPKQTTLNIVDVT